MSQTATITRPETALSLGGKDSPSSPAVADGIELQRVGSRLSSSKSKSFSRVNSRDQPQTTRRNSSEEEGDTGNVDDDEGDDDSPPPGHATHHELQRWNKPRGNVPRLAFAFLSFVIAGMNDAAIGVSLFTLKHAHMHTCMLAARNKLQREKS